MDRTESLNLNGDNRRSYLWMAWPICISVFWISFCFIPRCLHMSRADRGVYWLFFIVTSTACWLFWFCCYLSQFNPLFGPRMYQNTILIIAREWSNKAVVEL
ncbi:hypothetical protein HA402_011938 [Bradysia odoriphaga]|nr:hypothetical protein HA402_011938 [Bradysia odoriphaga]